MHRLLPICCDPTAKCWNGPGKKKKGTKKQHVWEGNRWSFLSRKWFQEVADCLITDVTTASFWARMGDLTNGVQHPPRLFSKAKTKQKTQKQNKKKRKREEEGNKTDNSALKTRWNEQKQQQFLIGNRRISLALGVALGIGARSSRLALGKSLQNPNSRSIPCL